MGLRQFFNLGSTVEGVKDNVIDYHFKCINPVEYETNLKMETTNRMFSYIFRQSKKRLSRKGINISGSLNDIDAFDVPKSYFNLIGTVINNTLKKIEKDVQKDNLKVMSCQVREAKFKKNKKGWIIHIKVGGDYVG